MNPLVLLGLGAVVIMAMGKKKPAPVEDGFEGDFESDDIDDDAPPVQRFVASKIEPRKTTMFAKAAPLKYRSTINSQTAVGHAKQCHLQGMNSADQITGCLANKLFPGWDWSSKPGWQADAWNRMLNIARIELGLQPIEYN